MYSACLVDKNGKCYCDNFFKPKNIVYDSVGIDFFFNSLIFIRKCETLKIKIMVSCLKIKISKHNQRINMESVLMFKFVNKHIHSKIKTNSTKLVILNEKLTLSDF